MKVRLGLRFQPATALYGEVEGAGFELCAKGSLVARRENHRVHGDDVAGERALDAGGLGRGLGDHLD